MQGKTASIAIIGLIAASSAIAQESQRIHERGVRVLQAEPATVTTTPTVTATTATATKVSVTATPVSNPAPLRPPLGPVIKDCPLPIAQSDLKLDAAIANPKTLAGPLASGHRFVVDLAQPYSADSGPPEMLAAWFDAVKASGGNVSVSQYCTASRGLGNWLAKLFGGGDSKQKPSAYAAARKYDVVLHANALDQKVTQIEFVPRAKSSI